MAALRLLILYDIEGWAWWHKALALKENLADVFDVDVARHSDEFDCNSYDYVLLFGAYMLEDVAEFPESRRILGLSTVIDSYVEVAVEKLMSGAVRALAPNCKIAYDRLKDLGNIFLCQNGVDGTVFYPPTIPPVELAACWVGNPNSEGHKGFDLIQEACGLTDTPLNYASLDASTGNNDGIVPHSEIRDTVYHASSFYVCASDNEATPNPALEALACGLPVITTRVGNMVEIIEDGVNGFFVERSVESITHGIERLQSADWEAMSRAARASIENGWTWKDKSRNYASMILALAREDGLVS